MHVFVEEFHGCGKRSCSFGKHGKSVLKLQLRYGFQKVTKLWFSLLSGSNLATSFSSQILCFLFRERARNQSVLLLLIKYVG